MTGPQFIATIAMVFLTVGWLSRRRPALHIPCMAVAFTIDFSLLLYLELTRNAVDTAVKEFAHDSILTVHILFSVSFTVLYFVQIATGIASRRRGGVLKSHCVSAMLFACSRIGGYITSFLI